MVLSAQLCKWDECLYWRKEQRYKKRCNMPVCARMRFWEKNKRYISVQIGEVRAFLHMCICKSLHLYVRKGKTYIRVSTLIRTNDE